MSAPLFKVKAVYDYSSPHEDDLSFPNGQIITVTEEEDADWYVGEYTDASGTKHDGLFPKNFVERYEPEVPSRPARAPRPKSEIQSPVAPPAEEPLPEPAPEEPEVLSRPPPPPAQEPDSAPAPPAPTQDENVRSLPPIAATKAPEPQPAAPKPTPAAPTAAASSSAKSPPPVSEKPSSFKDRIAAFNKAAAPPIAPFKPGAPPGGFIKKPFVAPPPSKNAYVPPPKPEPVQKTYRREEDPEILEKQAQDQTDAERAGLAGTTSTTEAEEGEDAPKPQSLKERIAMLQKQQMEQAARRADAAHKEKPKKPPKKRTESADRIPTEQSEGAELDRVRSGEQVERTSTDQFRGPSRVSTEPRSPGATAHEHEIFSDANDADQSAAGETTEDNEATSGVEDLEDRPSAHVARAPAAPKQESDVGEEEGTTEGDEEEDDDDEEEDDMDAETRRKMELRERMAKMSGGMGMAGMFGPPGGMPMPGAVPPKKRSTKERKSAEEAVEAPVSPPRRIPMVPVPGMQHVRSPDSEDTQVAVEKEGEPAGTITSERGPEAVPDVEDVKPEPAPRAQPVERGAPQDRAVPPPPAERGVPPPIPGGRPVPQPPPTESRPVPPPPSQPPMSPSAGSESDDEMSIRAKRMSGELSSMTDSGTLPMRPAPPPVPTAQATSPRVQGPQSPRSPTSPSAKRASYFGADPMSPTSPVTPGSERRASRIPPIPGSSPSVGLPPASARPPPPPPPAVSLPPPPPPPEASYSATSVEAQGQGESEYEGDYDTDIASGAKHKDALKAHAREPSLDDSTTADDTPIHTPLQTPQPPAHRAVPPPPPPTAAPDSRRSVDVPRAAPPPPPREVPPPQDTGEYDPYRYTQPARAVPPPPAPPRAPAPPPIVQEPEPVQEESSDDLYSSSPPRRSMDRPPPPPPAEDHPAPLPPLQPTPAPGRAPPRQSLDVTRANTRRSMDMSRPVDNGFIARDIDLGERTQWWTQANTPPPVFQNRNDVLYEMEDSTTSKRGGKTIVARDVYALFLDYSQTVVTARFDSHNPADVHFEQRHEPPPSRLRQDQLEDAWQRFGRPIYDAATRQKDHVVGDGTPHSFVMELIRPHKDALLPVGTRAYGALVYANLANASVQQFDEIRPGDIVTLRNARLEGKHGGLHQKYKMDVGMGNGHVAVVVDWDGTKKKVRAWEQGREKGKVRMESFRLGDLKSGEVRVWRVVGRGWVGWE